MPPASPIAIGTPCPKEQRTRALPFPYDPHHSRVELPEGGGALGLTGDSGLHAFEASTSAAGGSDTWEDRITLSILHAANHRSPSLPVLGTQTHSASFGFLRHLSLTSPSTDLASHLPNSASQSPLSESSNLPFLSPSGSSAYSPLTPSPSTSTLGPDTPPSFVHSHHHHPLSPTPPTHLSPPIQFLSPRKSSDRLGKLWRKASSTNILESGVSDERGPHPTHPSAAITPIGSKTVTSTKTKRTNALAFPKMDEGRTLSPKGIEGGPQVARREANSRQPGGGGGGGISRRISRSFSNLEHTASDISRSLRVRTSNERSNRGFSFDTVSTRSDSPGPSSPEISFTTFFPPLSPTAPLSAAFDPDAQPDLFFDLSPPVQTSIAPRPPAPPPFLGFGIRSSSCGSLSNGDHADEPRLLSPAHIDQSALYEKVRASLARPARGLQGRSSQASSPAPPRPSSLAASFETTDASDRSENFGDTSFDESTSSERERQNSSCSTLGLSSSEDVEAAEIGIGQLRRFEWGAAFGSSGTVVLPKVLGDVSPMNRGSLSLPDDEELQSWLPRNRRPAPVESPVHLREDSPSSSHLDASETPTLASEATSHSPGSFYSLSPGSTTGHHPSYPSPRQEACSSASCSSPRASLLPLSIEITEATPEKPTLAPPTTVSSLDSKLLLDPFARNRDSFQSERSDDGSSTSSGPEESDWNATKAKFAISPKRGSGLWLAVPVDDSSSESEEDSSEETGQRRVPPSIPLPALPSNASDHLGSSSTTTITSYASQGGGSSSMTLLFAPNHHRCDSGQTIQPDLISSGYDGSHHIRPRTHTGSTTQTSAHSAFLVDSYYGSGLTRSNGSTPTMSTFPRHDRIASSTSPVTPPSSLGYRYRRPLSIRSSSRPSSPDTLSCCSSDDESSTRSFVSARENDFDDDDDDEPGLEEAFRTNWGVPGVSKADVERLDRELIFGRGISTGDEGWMKDGVEDDDEQEEEEEEEEVIRVVASHWPMPPFRRIWVAPIEGNVVEFELVGKTIEYFPPSGHLMAPRHFFLTQEEHNPEDRTPSSYRRRPTDNSDSDEDLLTSSSASTDDQGKRRLPRRKRQTSLTAIHHFEPDANPNPSDLVGESTERGGGGGGGMKKSRRLSLSRWVSRKGGDKADGRVRA